MDGKKILELIQRLKVEMQQLRDNDINKKDILIERAKSVISKLFGDDSMYLHKLESISFEPEIVSYYNLFKDFAWKKGKEKFVNLMILIEEEIEFSMILSSTTASFENPNSTKPHENIFIVHGHNEEMKQSVARTVEKLGLNPIILHEQANKGRTIIEKFTDYSNVSFAIVVLSADDIGFSKTKKDDSKFRARQNVILELGFFLGKLGRQNVFALTEIVEGFEIPSDYNGVIFTAYDKDGRWRYDLVKELQACNFTVDANKII